LSNDYNNWCPEVYRGLFVDRHNDDQLRVAPCCQAVSNLTPVSNFDFKSNEYLQLLRSEFADGKKPAACSRCWQDEKLGKKSRRLSAIELFDIKDQSTQVVLESIDHTATWACNLGCIMCSPMNSSTLATELDISPAQLFSMGRRYQKSNNFLNPLDVTNVKKLHFNGGEPLLNNDQIELIQKLADQGVLHNTFISYNTNGTVLPSTQLVELWKQTKLVKLFFSIDATGTAYEYIRYRASWKDTVDNILFLKQSLPSNVMFGLNVTIGAYNVLEMLDLWNWFNSHLLTNREGDSSDFCWQSAYNYNMLTLLPNIKNDAILQLQDIPEFSGLVNMLKSDHVANNTWIKQLDTIDTRRNTNWKQSLQIGKYY
jgi:organic radical activating enzyme